MESCLNTDKTTKTASCFHPFYKHKWLLFSRNPLSSNTEAIKVSNPTERIQEVFVSALKASGFGSISGDRFAVEVLPCPVGTFSNSSSQRNEGCIPCPPGMLCVVFY